MCWRISVLISFKWRFRAPTFVGSNNPIKYHKKFSRLARSIPQKTYSLDLVAKSDDIIACDMAKTPLETGSIDIVVFCLSLMGTNVKDFILEANRVLKEG